MKNYWLARAALIACVLAIGALCTCCSSVEYNVHVHKDGIKYANEVKFPSGQGGDSSDEGGPGAESAGGSGTGSPGVNAVADGYGNITFVINVSGEATPTSETTTDAQVDADITP